MRNTWARAWLAASALLVAAAAIARGRHDTLLKVEEPVMEWLLDGTDTSGWDRASFLSASSLIIVGTAVLAVAAFFLDRKVSFAIVLSSVFATAAGTIVRNIVDRPSPISSAEGASTELGSFPSLELVQTGVFWGLIVLVLWWVGVPKLVWQIGVELAIVITLVSAIRLTVAGSIWPSDAVGSAILIVVSLILAAIVFEAFAPRLPWNRPVVRTERSVAA